MVTRQNEELSLGRDGVVGRKEWRDVKALFMSGANLLENMATRRYRMQTMPHFLLIFSQ